MQGSKYVCVWRAQDDVLSTGPRGWRTPCVPSVGGSSTCGGSNSPVVVYLHVPRTTACLNGNLCFGCSTCDATMDLLSAHATRRAPEQARLAPTAPHCVATGPGGLGQMAGRPPGVGDVAALAPAVGSNFSANGEYWARWHESMPPVAQLLSPADAPGTRTCR